MKNLMASVIGGLVCVFGLSAQNNSLDDILQEVENNNKDLKSYRSLMESEILELKTRNNLPDPQASAYYLNEKEGNTGDYTEFQISQSIEFPTVYAARGEWIDREEKRADLKYQTLRQDILLEAKKYIQDLVFSNKKKVVEEERIAQAEEVYENTQTLYDKKEVGVLELNKAKVAWLQEQFRLEEIENEIRNILIAFKNLNGGRQINIDIQNYGSTIEIASLDPLWQQKLENDPKIALLRQNQETSLQNIKLERNKRLPDLTAGYNFQGVSQQTYSGVYGGISIPLWSSRNKVKAAKARYEYEQVNTEAVTRSLNSNFEERYNSYSLLLEKYGEYQLAMDELESEDLLYRAFELGEISFMEYYLEIQFYQDAYNQMLEAEHELYQLKAELQKHQL